jgi:hypothetical protein
MGFPRSKYVREGQEGVYHCFNRCVRRAFLYGFDPVTGQDFSHRKEWLVDRLRYLASIFAIEVCAYAIMLYHTIARTRPDIAAYWSDREVGSKDEINGFMSCSCVHGYVMQVCSAVFGAYMRSDRRLQ